MIYPAIDHITVIPCDACDTLSLGSKDTALPYFHVPSVVHGAPSSDSFNHPTGLYRSIHSYNNVNDRLILYVIVDRDSAS